MKRFILKLSQAGLVSIITIIAILIATFLNYVISITLEGEFTRNDFIRSSLIPIILAPLLAWHLVKMTFKALKVEKQLKRLTTYDSLTQLFSRGAYFEKSEAVFEEAKSYGKSFCVMVLDLDHFKSINDNFGHDAGDYVLYKFGELIRNLGISNHLCGRVGGEEFAFTLVNMDIQDSEQFAELLRNKLANTIMLHNNHELKVTTSIGISEYQDDELTLNELLIQADKALYQAKRNGRNQTVVYEAGQSFSAEMQTLP